MRWIEITEKLVHAMPLRAQRDAMGQAVRNKAEPLIAPPPITPDPTVAIAQGLAQGIAPVVNGAINTAVQADDQEEALSKAQKPAQAMAQQAAENLQDDPHLQAIKRLAHKK
jgi:hypothetical protein